ncbi:MAG: LptF/LptG family permease [Planctomycetota bacterium]
MNIAALFVILFAFVITIDVSINIDRFWRIAGEIMAAGENGEGGTFRRVLVTVLLVVDLWWPRLLDLFNVMLGLVLVGAMGFTCTQLSKHREMVAILAGGRSLFSVMRPILIVAVGLLVLQQVNQELVLPRIAAKLLRSHDDAGTHNLDSQNVKTTPDASGRLWYAKRFDPNTSEMQGVYVWERADSGRAERRYEARSASWIEPSGDGVLGAWALEGVRVLGADRVGPIEDLELKTDLDPTALTVRQFSRFRSSLSWGQLSQLIHQTEGGDPELVARLKRTQFGRISLAAADLLALMMAMPFFLRSLPENMLGQSLKASPLAIAALLGGTLGSAAQIPGVPPELSVFVPVLVLLPLTLASVASIRT